MPTTATAHEGKTDFVKTVLANNERANTKAVNDAWKAAGREGQISPTLVNKLRSALGLAGNLRSKNKKTEPATAAKTAYTGKKRGRKPKQAGITTVDLTPSYLNGRKANETKDERPSRGGLNADRKALEELEADFDRLLFKVMGMGGLPAIEESLRQTRRLLYGGFSGNRI
jgi:hypothetical protein